MLDLFKIDFYDSLFYKDTRPKTFVSLIQNHRNDDEALAYYGIKAIAGEFLKQREKARKREEARKRESQRRALVEEAVKKASKLAIPNSFNSLADADMCADNVSGEDDSTILDDRAILGPDSAADTPETDAEPVEVAKDTSEPLDSVPEQSNTASVSDRHLEAVTVECRITSLGADGKATIVPINGDFSGVRLNDICVVVKG